MLVVGCLSFLAYNAHQYLKWYSPSDQATFVNIGHWAHQHPSVRLGSTQTGIIGFLAENITNLDGKVNSDALSARSKGVLGEYVRQENIDLLLDYPNLIEPVVRETRQYGSPFEEIATLGTPVDSNLVVEVFAKGSASPLVREIQSCSMVLNARRKEKLPLTSFNASQ
jgi:hypothetical protein